MFRLLSLRNPFEISRRFKDSNGNKRTICIIYSKVATKTPDWSHWIDWICSGVSIVDFKQVNTRWFEVSILKLLPVTHSVINVHNLPFFKPLGSFDRALIGPFRRNFGNSLDQCLKPIQHPPNFCTSQNVPHDAPTSFVRYRTINGTCNTTRKSNLRSSRHCGCQIFTSQYVSSEVNLQFSIDI